MEQEVVKDARDIRIETLEEQLSLLLGEKDGDGDEVSKLKKCVTRLLLRLQDKDFQVKSTLSKLERERKEVETRKEELEDDFKVRPNYRKALIKVMGSKLEELALTVDHLKLENHFNKHIKLITDPDSVEFLRGLTRAGIHQDVTSRTLIHCLENPDVDEEKKKIYMKQLRTYLFSQEHMLFTARIQLQMQELEYKKYSLLRSKLEKSFAGETSKTSETK